MNRVQSIGRAVSHVVLAALAWAGFQAVAMAAGGGVPAPAAPGGDSNAYVFNFMLVLICVTLGLAAALHSSRRSDRPKFQGLMTDEAPQRKASKEPAKA
jgi:TRAP-type C4-dicarboxylate transport system permease small subunit